MSRTGPLHAFDLPEHATLPAICVAFGDDDQLRRLAVAWVRRLAAGDDDATPPTLLDADNRDLAWRDLHDALGTRSLFGGDDTRLVVLRGADGFVSKYRDRFEALAAEPPATGRLLLALDSFPSNTRLYKAVEKQGLAIDCRLPCVAGKRDNIDAARIARWLVDQGAQRGVRLDPRAAALLWDLSQPALGVAVQGLDKLALFVAEGGAVDADLVQRVVGGWRQESAWKLLDSIASGRAADALRQLDRLIEAGEEPIGILARMAWGLRRFQGALRAIERAERAGRPVAFSAALLEGGFKEYPRGALADAETQLKQLGRQRIARLCGQLFEIDLALKGSHSRADRGRYLLEELIVRLSTAADPRRAASTR